MKAGRPRLSTEEKARRGTLRAYKEREYAGIVEAGGGVVQEPLEGPARDYAGVAAAYAANVLSGGILAGRWVRLACQRQVDDLDRASDPYWPFTWEPKTGAAACRFLENCPHVEGRWASPLLELQPWQVFLVMALFGWRVKGARHRRRFTTFFLEVGRKAAKSTLIAAIAFYHLLREDEIGASVICGATSGKQARIVFGIMRRMADGSPWLRSQGVQTFMNAILTADGKAEPVNAKASSQDGLNPSLIILDESHAQKFPLFNVLSSAQGSRDNPLLLCPTTAGFDLLSVGYALHQQAQKVLDRVLMNECLLAVLYTLDDGDDWRDEQMWIKANPMIGISPKIENVRQDCLDAMQVKSREPEFLVKVCSRWQQAAHGWLSMADWDACAEPTLRLETFIGQRCWMGADLAQLDDMAAVSYVFERDGVLIGFVRCYLPIGVVGLRARAVPEYQVWLDEGLLIGTDGTLIDVDRIEADIRADCLRFKVQGIVFDQFGSAQTASRLAAAGLPAQVEPKNARTFTPPSRELEARVRHARFKHDGNSLLKWHASNVAVDRRRNDTILPMKEHAESPHKIDGIDALLSAIGAWLRGQGHAAKDYQIVILGGKKA